MCLILFTLSAVAICSISQISRSRRSIEQANIVIEEFIAFLETGDIDLLRQITAGGLKLAIQNLDIDPLSVPEIIVFDREILYEETSNKKILNALLKLKMNISFDTGEVHEISQVFDLSFVRSGTDVKICSISMMN